MAIANELKEYMNLINGKLVPASSGATIDSIDPATGKMWAKVPRSDINDVEAIVQAANDAFPAWAALTAAERAGYLRRIGDILSDYSEELGALETRDNGWVISNTIYGLIPTLKQIWYDAASACTKGSRGETVPMGPTSYGYTFREPIGVVLGIIPWNAPLFTFSLKAAYAIAAGNTIVIKASEQASVSALRLGEILSFILPPGVVNVISGYGHEIGEPLVKHKGINKVSLTGSGATAKAVAKSTSEYPKPLILELGGKSPSIVFDDADLDKTAERITSYSIFTGNAGQICVGGSRIFIQSTIFDEMVARIKEKMSMIQLGDTMDMRTTMGPIGNLPQYQKVISYLQIGSEEGEIISGGRYGGKNLFPHESQLENGFWVEPTLIKVNHNKHRVCREEIFGPVAVVMPFDTEDEAVALANDTEFGLAAGVWTTNLARAQRMTRKLEAGSVWVNTYGAIGADLPFGGFKNSGFGTDSILEYTREKACVIEIG